VLLIVVIVLHAGYAIAIKWLFFAHGSLVPHNEDKPKAPEGEGAMDGETARRLFNML
jgi:hypothetical protein